MPLHPQIQHEEEKQLTTIQTIVVAKLDFELLVQDISLKKGCLRLYKSSKTILRFN